MELYIIFLMEWNALEFKKNALIDVIEVLQNTFKSQG